MKARVDFEILFFKTALKVSIILREHEDEKMCP